MISYAIFDLDGTLLDSMEMWSNVGREVLKSHGVTPPENIENVLKVMSLQQSSEYLIKEFHIRRTQDELISEICKMVENKYKHEVTLKPFVLEYLQYLKFNDVKMCIATACEYSCAVSALKRLNVYDFFEFILTSSDVGISKGSPEFFNLAGQKLGARTKETVVFEDALHAIESAKKAGFYVVGVHDKTAEDDRENIKKICDYYISSFKEMREIK